MKKWKTRYDAVNPKTKNRREFSGPIIEAEDYEGAIQLCLDKGWDHLHVSGEYLGEVDMKTGNLKWHENVAN